MSIEYVRIQAMEIYHTLSRGVEKRNIFLNNRDYLRFIHNLLEFNDINWSTNSAYFFNNSIDIASRYEEKKRIPLVKLHAFCLMPNHYHLMLSPLVEKGISRFMKKINMGYAKYFNQKNKRKGALFESRYKSVPVKNESHFTYLPFYIHLNPLDLYAPGWRNRKISNYKNAFNFLENYKWSSFPDYIDKTNFPLVTSRKFLHKCFGQPTEHKQNLLQWLREIDLSEIEKILLE